MAKSTSAWILLFAALTFEGLLQITEGIPQKSAPSISIHHQVKRDTSVRDSYQDDYDPISDDEYDENYKSDNGYDEKAISVDPNIITQGNTYTVDKGMTIRLPCYVDKFPRGSYTIMWRKVDSDPNKYLSVGTNTYGNDRINIEVVNDEDIGSQNTEEASVTHRGSTLSIPLAKAEDEGQYVCIVPRSTGDIREIKHTVSIRDPPTIIKDPSNGHLPVLKGDSVTMSCYGEGRPKPTIKWQRLGKRLPDGKTEIEGETLSFVNVNRHHSGRYQCTADNGYGKPATQEIMLQVDYSPEVEATEIFVHAKTGENNVELICNVHAHPNSVVKWFKNKMELSDETAQLRKNGNRHVLNIPRLAEADFGNYTCRATNKFGTAQRILEISGKAGFAKFTSTPKGTEPTSFVLEWTSKSHTDITKFELKWREHGETSWRSETIKPIRKNAYEWIGKHAIQGLKPASRFEATIAAENTEDWSRHSPTYHFSTFGAEPLRGKGSGTTIQPFLSNMLSSRSQILLSVTIAYFMTRWHKLL